MVELIFYEFINSSNTGKLILANQEYLYSKLSYYQQKSIRKDTTVIRNIANGVDYVVLSNIDDPTILNEIKVAIVGKSIKSEK